MRKNRTQGFTLIELLIAIAIIAILAAVLIPNLINVRTRALQAAAQSYARDVLMALESVQSTYTNVDWQKTALANTLTIVNGGSVSTAVTGWKDYDGNDLSDITVNFTEFLKKPGHGIETILVGATDTSDPDSIRICVSQRTPKGKYNYYSLLPNTREFRAKLKQDGNPSDISACP